MNQVFILFRTKVSAEEREGLGDDVLQAVGDGELGMLVLEVLPVRLRVRHLSL
jgi:hypothetical protein